MHWVNKNYLAKLNKPEVHIYDNDVKKYMQAVEQVNGKAGCWATLTAKYEIENYIHPKHIKSVYNITEDFVKIEGDWLKTWNNKNIPSELSVFLKELKKNGHHNIIGEGQGTIKNILSQQAAKLMSIDDFRELDAYDEISGWFDRINERLNN